MRRDKIFSLVSACALASLGLSACASVPADEVSPAVGAERLDVGGDVELFSWWTSGGEREALDSLIFVHQARVKSSRVENAAVEFAEKAGEQLRVRIEQGLPPDLFQANSGADLLGWVITNGRDSKDSVVEDLTDLSDALRFGEIFPEELMESVRSEGRVFAMPVNIHRVNSLFYRTDLFKKFGLSLPNSYAELRELCQEITARQDIQDASPSGKMSCLALGNKWNWTVSLLTFEMILPSISGPEFYVDYFLGKKSALAPEILETLAAAEELYCGGTSGPGCVKNSWFNPDIDDLNWDEGVNKLSQGTALMAPMGDWAKGYLESDAGGNLKAGEDFDVAPFPGTRGIYVFSADVFALPKGANNRDGARSFLKTVSSAAGQVAFNAKKGSIPARRDVAPGNFDALQQATIVDFNESVRVRALSGLLPASARNRLHPELTSSLRAGNRLIIERYLEANYPLK